jgi:hypothetical protein
MGNHHIMDERRIATSERACPFAEALAFTTMVRNSRFGCFETYPAQILVETIDDGQSDGFRYFVRMEPAKLCSDALEEFAARLDYEQKLACVFNCPLPAVDAPDSGYDTHASNKPRFYEPARNALSFVPGPAGAQDNNLVGHCHYSR